MAVIETTLAVSANQAAEKNASRLIIEGLTRPTGKWSGPTAAAENAVIEERGWEYYGNFFLGRRDGADEETKNLYVFPFSDDFERVNLVGLRAIRSRAAANGDQAVFAAAGRLIDLYKEQTTEASAPKFNVCFRKRRSKFQQVDVEAGLIENVSLIQAGVASGHSMRIDQRSLETAIAAMGDNLPAFITHDGALDSDRILQQVGAFSDFHLEAGKLRATFRAFESFRLDESNRFNRLFDIAGEMPDAFGVSLVFDADLVWIDYDGREWSFEEKPEGINAEFPSVRFLNISSADFVETPAANDGLFSKPKSTLNKIMDESTEVIEEKTELSATAEIVETETNLDETAESKEEMVAALESQIEELTAKLADLTSEHETLKGELTEANAKCVALETAGAVDALDVTIEDKQTIDVVTEFTEGDANTQRRLWETKKAALLAHF